MGKKAKTKKAEKKQAKKRAKVAEKVDRWIAKQDLSEQELMMAGLGLMARAVEQSKKKAFKKAVKAGRRIADAGLPSLETLLAQDLTEPDAGDAVISYEARGGGWYGVSVDGVTVDSVQGEEAAAARAAELFAAHAALDSDRQESVRTGMFHSGGGWYDLLVRGVPVARVRGKDAAEERFAEIESLRN